MNSNDIYDTYVRDKNGLGMEKYFSETNPAALQEMTAVMLETIRKGMWDASDEQTKTLADLHARMVEKHGAACSGFVCDNSRLRDFIKSNIPKESAAAYDASVASVRAENIQDGNNGQVMKREELNKTESTTNRINGLTVALSVAAALIIMVAVIRRRRKMRGNNDGNSRIDHTFPGEPQFYTEAHLPSPRRGCCSQPLDNGFHCIHDRIRKQPVKDKNRRLAVAT